MKLQSMSDDNSIPPLSDNETFTLTVAAVNQPPTSILLSNNQAFDGILNDSVVGVLTTIDADLPDNHSYTLVDNAGGRFALGGNGGEELRVLDTSLLDSATSGSHLVTVRTTDSGGSEYTDNFTITVALQLSAISEP